MPGQPRRLILPLLLAVLAGGCAETGASLRQALDAGGGDIMAPAPGPADRARSGQASGNRTGASATRVATRPFFVAEPLQVGDPLPDAPIPRAEFPEIQMSDALLYLLRNVTLRLAVDENLEDRTLQNLVLEGDFTTAFATLAQKGNFLYRRQGDVLHIEASARYQAALPPVGYVGPQGRRDAVSGLNPFDDLVARLKKAGARDVRVLASDNRITFTTSLAGRTPALEALDTFRQQAELIAWKMTVVRLQPGPLAETSWTTFSPDLQPLPLEGQPGGVRAYSGRFDAAMLTRFFATLKQNYVPLEKGVALLPANLPLSFNPTAALCPAGGGKSKAAPRQKITLQTRRDQQQLRTNFSATLPGCATTGTSMALSTATDKSIVFVGLGGNLALILEPQLIRFEGERERDDQ